MNEVKLLLNLVACGVVMGILFRVARGILAVLAFPVYLGLTYYDPAVKRMKALRLNIPKGGKKRIGMDLCAAAVFVSVFPVAVVLFQASVAHPVIHRLSEGALLVDIPGPFAVMSFLGLIGMYGISYFTEEDNDGYFERLMKIEVPTFWKKIIPWE